MSKALPSDYLGSADVDDRWPLFLGKFGEIRQISDLGGAGSSNERQQ
jgi:hypothetical protein